ncbi:hypothetical protein ACEE65_11185, partial [Streptococcus pluranimalium]
SFSNSFFVSFLAKISKKTGEIVFFKFSLNFSFDRSKGFKENFNWENIKEYRADMFVEEKEHDRKAPLKSKYLIW